jgi:TfoX/Sxy family transcriptional regulator of competence genes
MPGMPKPSEETKDLFRAALPEDEHVVTKPMFGQLAGFVNGHMFTGIFGDTIFVRIDGPDREALLQEEEAHVFAPMGDRPMKDYVVLPVTWLEDMDRVRDWMGRGLATAAALPPKVPKPPKPKAKKAK